MNDFINTPFEQELCKGVVEGVNQIHPYAILWSLRILEELGGSREFIAENCFSHKWIARHLGFSEKLITDEFNPQAAYQELTLLHQQCEKAHAQQQFHLNSNLEANLDVLQKLLGFNDVEREILVFIVLMQSEQLLNDLAETLGSMNSTKTLKVVSIILNLPFEHVRQALASQACLHRTGLVSLQSYNCYLNNKLNLVSNQMVDKLLMYNHDVMDLFAGTINKSTPAELLLTDYAHIDEQLNLLLAYLKQAQHQQQSAINIFLYGSSGTGKTQLCKVLAAELNLDLYEISCEDEDGDPVTATERLCAYRAAQNIFKSQAALLMFDEVEDVFNDAENGAGMKSTAQSRKAWINRMLENNPSPTIWVSNSDELDPAFVRRFDMVLEVKVPPKKQRMTMIKQYCPSDFDDHYHEALANVEHLSPAVLRRTYRVAQTAKRSNELLNVQDSMITLISSTLKAQGHQPFKLQNSDALPQFYDLSFIHTKANLSQIATGMKQHGFGRLCLYGPSGTGKTAFARWMAEYTAQPLFIKRGSDILSPWVGEMEQNLAKAFAQAEEQNAILLLDEVDSLLQDRSKATRSWEISQVNEFLVQLESFNGIVITTTNRFDDLDQAALRRFDFKIHFDYLTYAQRFKLLQQVCQQLGLSVEEQQVRDQLKRLNCLCAGDFSVIVRQSFFHPFTDVDAVLQHLASEMEVKLKKSPEIGFNIPA